MNKLIVSLLISLLLFSSLAFGQTANDEQVIAKIKTEGFQNSKSMDTLGYLADVFGPRLTNSPNLKAAQAWTRNKLASWGLHNAAIEPWGTFGAGWAVDRFSAEMLAPTYDRLNVYPLAWSPSITKTISGSPVLVDIKSPADFDKYRGKLKDAIVFRGIPAPETEAIRSRPQFQRLTDDQLRKAAQATDPSAASDLGGSTTTLTDEEADWQSGLSKYNVIVKFLHDEGVAALVQASRFPNGVLLTQGFYDTNTANNVPAFVMSLEQYGRIVRLIGRKVPVKIELSLQTHSTSETTGSNIVAEIPGSDPAVKDEVVMIGGHFDSWHSGTGATDNGAGCAAAMEAMRILSAVGAKPRRTIRVVLWDGEEQDYFGSTGYARKHFGDPFTGKLKPNAEKLDAYLNLDNGSGKIRGIFLQGNEAARSEFTKLLKPFDYLGANTISILNTGETDHMIFSALGFPSFEFIQDPLDYESRVHHSNLDVMEAVNENDLKINAVVMASVAYGLAMSDQPLPRAPAPR